MELVCSGETKQLSQAVPLSTYAVPSNMGTWSKGNQKDKNSFFNAIDFSKAEGAQMTQSNLLNARCHSGLLVG